MAEVTRKRVGELARGVFTVLISHPEGLPAKMVLERMWNTVPPTEFERQNYPGSPEVRRFEKMIRFATISSVKAGWLQKNRGLWSLTDEGRAAHARFQDPYEFIREAGRLYKKWKDAQPGDFAFDDGSQDLATEAEEAATTLEEAEESAWIETYLSEMNPFDFQQVVAGLFRGMGYHVSWIAPLGPDRGIDVIAHSDPLGVTGPRIKVQVKRTAERIGAR
ncbi:MAG TPA: restriction endonuclease [Vicinamibacterales bacterium]